MTTTKTTMTNTLKNDDVGRGKMPSFLIIGSGKQKQKQQWQTH